VVYVSDTIGPLRLSGLLEEELERGQWTRLREFKLHQLRLAQWQLIQYGARLFYRCGVHEKYGTFLILASPPLVDLAGQITLKCGGHFLWEDRLKLVGRQRGRKAARRKNFDRRDDRKRALGISADAVMVS
jgi:hypothetical protein